MESACDLAGAGDRVPEGFNDEKIREICVSTMSFHEAELIGLDAPADRVDALPSPLVDLKHQRQAILHDGMIDSASIDPLGVHTASTYRAVMDPGCLFKLDRTDPGGLSD